MKVKIQITTPIAIIIAAIILSVGLVGYGYVTTTNNSATPKTMFTGKTVDSSDYIEGKTKSNVVVVEYSDPECPFCIMFHPTIKQIRDDYKDKIAFIYRHFPLTSIHPKAFDEARALACAGKVGGDDSYYKYINAYFDLRVNDWQKTKSQQPPAITDAEKQSLITQTGLDADKFNACLKNNDTAQIVNDSISDALKAIGNQAGTPTTFVLKKSGKGYEVIAKIEGAQSPDFVKAAIDQALAK